MKGVTSSFHSFWIYRQSVLCQRLFGYFAFGNWLIERLELLVWRETKINGKLLKVDKIVHSLTLDIDQTTESTNGKWRLRLRQTHWRFSPVHTIERNENTEFHSVCVGSAARTMPSWLKKHFKSLKHEVSERLWLAKNKNRLSDRQQRHASADINGNQSPVIRNDLRSARRHNKDDKNAYRDYSKRCAEVLFYQNNCAVRCAQEPLATSPTDTEQIDKSNLNKTDNVKSVTENVCDKDNLNNAATTATASTGCYQQNCEFDCVHRSFAPWCLGVDSLIPTIYPFRNYKKTKSLFPFLLQVEYIRRWYRK